MPSWTEPVITDRSAVDVAARAAKAFFNIADWVRIYGNSQQVNALANAIAGLSVPFTPLATPTMAQFPSASAINTLIGNIEAVRAGISLPAGAGLAALKADYQAGSSAVAPSYIEVNAWEQNLSLLLTLLTAAFGYDQAYCGVPEAGQSHVWQVRFRAFPFIPEATSPVRRARLIYKGSTGTNLTRENSWRHY